MSPEFEERFGPGRLVLVVGPSGAGKDTLIRLARERLVGHPHILFPRRVVTRESTVWEEHDSVSPEQFEAGLRFGLYPLHWMAHGLRYGLPVSIVVDVTAGRTIVANVSRHVIATARALFANVSVAYITAPPDILASRVSERGRDSAPAERVARMAPDAEECDSDIVINNVGEPHVGAARLAELMRAPMAEQTALVDEAASARP